MEENNTTFSEQRWISVLCVLHRNQKDKFISVNITNNGQKWNSWRAILSLRQFWGNRSLRLIKAWVNNDFRLQCPPPSKVRGIRVDCASNHSYLESRSRSSWTASAILKCRLCIGFSHLRWWIRQFRGRHQKKVITFSLLSSFPQKMAWYRYLKAKENPFEPTKTSKHRSQHVHWFHCKYNAT